MKNKILSFATFITLTLVISNCKQKNNAAQTSAAKPAAVSKTTTTKYITNVSESSISWKGFKPTGSHMGTLTIENGVFKAEGSTLKSGTFVIDMNSITVTDLEGDKKAGLESHLKGTVPEKEGHFFNVTKFPTATFELTNSKLKGGKTLISGNLSLKGNTNNITFPATVSQNGNMLTLTSEAFTIDRTKWSVNYGSKSIFDNLGDKFINDDIELQINIKAKKE